MKNTQTAVERDHLKLAKGVEVLWRDQVTTRLLQLQRASVSWVNPKPRWRELHPVIITSYAVLTREILKWEIP